MINSTSFTQHTLNLLIKLFLQCSVHVCMCACISRWAGPGPACGQRAGDEVASHGGGGAVSVSADWRLQGLWQDREQCHCTLLLLLYTLSTHLTKQPGFYCGGMERNTCGLAYGKLFTWWKSNLGCSLLVLLVSITGFIIHNWRFLLLHSHISNTHSDL